MRKTKISIGVAGLFLFACTGEIQVDVSAMDPPARASAEDSAEGWQPGSMRTPTSPNPETRGDYTADPERPPEAPRLNRLTHRQWVRSAHAMLGMAVDASLEGQLLEDAVTAMIPNTQELVVNETLTRDYEAIAGTIARRFVDDEAAMSALIPTAGSDGERAEAFVQVVGRRAYRRPLSHEERDDLLQLFEAVLGEFGFASGIEVLVRALLQSPNFIYRVEATTAPDESGFVPLSAFELAAKLSFFLWDSAPDDRLLNAAESGQLTATLDAYRAEVGRLMADARAHGKLRELYEHILEPNYESIQRSTEAYPEFVEGFGQSALEEQRRWVNDVLLEREGDLAELFAAPESYVDDTLARIYGLPETGEGFRRVDLDPNRRGGLLSQVGFLSSSGENALTDVIHRGVFVNERVLCRELVPPPKDLAIPDPEVVPGSTTRETISALTETGVCASCHTASINVMGYPFEEFDALGRANTEEASKPVDATAILRIDGDSIAVDGYREMIDALTSSKDFHECQVGHWTAFALGLRRSEVHREEGVIQNLAHLSRERALPIKALIVRILESPAFTYRVDNEEGK